MNAIPSHPTYLQAGLVLSIPQNEYRKFRRHDLVDLVQPGKQGVALIQVEVQVPRVVYPTVSLGEDLERGLDSDSEVVARTANGPKEVWVLFL